MAEIDKSLPNQTRTEVKVPSEEIDVKEQTVIVTGKHSTLEG